MDPALVTALLTATAAAVKLIDNLADPVERFLTKRSAPTVPKEHRCKIEGKEEDGITGDQLEKLPRDCYEHIRTLEESMQRHYRLWQKIYPRRNSSADPLVNAKVDESVRELILNMKADLVGIINFLQSIGVHLDDHYKMFRNLIEQVDSPQ
jgi:hypothetical protein